MAGRGSSRSGGAECTLQGVTSRIGHISSVDERPNCDHPRRRVRVDEQEHFLVADPYQNASTLVDACYHDDIGPTFSDFS
jgi:hypothetical protein